MKVAMPALVGLRVNPTLMHQRSDRSIYCPGLSSAPMSSEDAVTHVGVILRPGNTDELHAGGDGGCGWKAVREGATCAV
jgi:hypothetical protein